MMKIILNILLLICSTTVFGQKENDFIFFKVYNDTLILYLDNVGNITTKSRAIIYRKSLIDSKSYNYKGNIEDYYLNNQKAFQSTVENGNLVGITKKYYKNGQLKYQGFYKNSLKDSLWIFYYDNGNIEKNVIYKLDSPYVKDLYKANGKCIVVNGNGRYKGTIISGYKQTNEYLISGNIKDGRQDGKWNWTGNGYGSTATEYFENGKFIKGSSNGLIYNTDPKISLTGFNLHENVDVFKFISVPNSKEFSYKFSQMLRYKSSNDLNKTFVPELTNFMQNINKNNNLLNYWCFIQFRITKENVTDNIIVYSNEDKIPNEIKQFILNSVGFDTAKPNDERVDCSIYLSIFCENGKINIPEYSTIADFNIMNLIPNN